MEDLCEVTFALGNPRKSRGTGNGINTAITAKNCPQRDPRNEASDEPNAEASHRETTNRADQEEDDQEEHEEHQDEGTDWRRPSLAEQVKKQTPS